MSTPPPPDAPTALVAFVDGRLVPAADATVSVYDRGFRSGEGVFETLRAYGDHVFRLDAHLARARAGADELGFDAGDADALASAVTRTARANLDAFRGGDQAVRLTISAGQIDPLSPFPGTAVGAPTVVVTSHRLREPDAPGATAVTVPLARELPHVKAVSYLVAVTARRRARERGADEAVLTTPGGDVLEGSSSNLFAVIDGRLTTPPLSAGVLAGVTRGVVEVVAARLGLPFDERSLSVRELAGADEALLTATTREVVPLIALDDRPIADARPGPITRRVQAGYRDEVAREVSRARRR